MEKKLLFSVGRNEFELQTFRCGGKGGQNVNKLETGVRVVHAKSGARGECREERSQYPNKIRAFTRCVESDTFQRWLKTEIAVRLGHPRQETEQEIKQRVDLFVDRGLREGWIALNKDMSEWTINAPVGA